MYYSSVSADVNKFVKHSNVTFCVFVYIYIATLLKHTKLYLKVLLRSKSCKKYQICESEFGYNMYKILHKTSVISNLCNGEGFKTMESWVLIFYSVRTS